MKNKLQAKILAQAVCESLADKSKAQATDIVDNFLTYLKNHRLLPLLPEILEQVEKFVAEKEGLLKVELISAREIDKSVLAEIKKYLHKRLNVEIKEKVVIDEKILGGVKIKYQDKLLDLSLSRRIKNLNKSLVN